MSNHATPSPPALQISAVAGADLSSSQYHVVIPHSTAGQIVTAGANAPLVLGVLVDNPEADQTGNYQKDGAVQGIAHAAFSLNALLTTSSTGRFVTAGSGEHVWAVARYVAATEAGNQVTVEFGYRGLAA